MKNINTKSDAINKLREVRRDIRSVRTTYFDLRPVTLEDEPKIGIFYGHSKEEWLKEMGVMKNPNDYEYGYFRSNANNAKVNNKLTVIDQLIAEILTFLEDCRIKPKVAFSEIELSRFIVMSYDADSQLVLRVKEGVYNG